MSTFGLVEYEQLAAKIILYLKEHGDSWKTTFRMGDLDVTPVWFAMFCASGWVQNNWFPKGTFVVSEGFVERVQKRH